MSTGVPAQLGRLHVVTATEAPVAVVFRRGPSRVCSIYLWHTDTGELEPGTAIRARIYAEATDLSPNGRHLAYLAMRYKPFMPMYSGREGHWPTTYFAISRPPWLFALCAAEGGGPWTPGVQFVSRADRIVTPEVTPFVGQSGYDKLPYRMAYVQTGFAVERARGFVEAPNSKPKEHLGLRLHKPSPDGRYLLRLWHFLSRKQALCTAAGEPIEFDDAVWADWTPDNRLLVATRDAKLQIQELDRRSRRTVSEHVLDNPLDFRPPPDWAQEW